jgi:hypothetical protein
VSSTQVFHLLINPDRKDHRIRCIEPSPSSISPLFYKGIYKKKLLKKMVITSDV